MEREGWQRLCDLAFSEVMRVGADSTVCDRSRQPNLSCVFLSE
jgi:hypothetical protein